MTDIIARLAALVAIAIGAGPAAAQSTFTPPDGCTAFLTVQERSCTVSHYWTCEADPAGTHWRLSMDADGPFGLSHADDEFRWLLGYGLRDGTTTTLVEPEEDPASLSELLATGTDTMAFSTVTTAAGMPQRRRDYTGFDSLLGDVVTIDGVPLEQTEFRYQYETGAGPRVVEGNQYVSREWRLFFGGEETVTAPDGATFEVNHAPAEFFEPRENGFLSTRPIHDCGDVMSGLPVLPEAG